VRENSFADDLKKQENRRKPMKKTLWIAMTAALAASVVAASAQEVLSANAVGYIKKTLPADAKLISLAIPLNNMNEAENVFGRTSVAEEAPAGSIVYFWDETLQVWSGGGKSTKGWQPAQSNRVVEAGEAFFLKGPSGGTDTEVTITGEVPDDSELTRVMSGENRLSAIANPFPVDIVFGESDLALNATAGSVVYFWDEALQVWSGGGKSTKGWQPAQSNRVVLAAEGFFMREFGSVNSWTQSKPYTWP
jgi:hypothetical protein